MKRTAIKKTVVMAGALALAAAGLSAAAAPQQFVSNADADSRACFRTSDVVGFAATKISGRDGVNLRVRKDVYQLEFAGPCPEIRESTRVAVEGRTPSMVCSGADADIVAFSQVTSKAARCKVSGIRKIEPSELSSLPRNEQP